MNIQTRYKLYTNKMSKYFSLDLIGHIRPPRMKIKSMKRWKEFQFFILVFGLVFHWVLAFKNPHQHGWRKCFSFVFQVSFAFISHPPTHMEKVFGNDWWSHGGCLNISFTHSHTHTHTHSPYHHIRREILYIYVCIYIYIYISIVYIFRAHW